MRKINKLPLAPSDQTELNRKINNGIGYSNISNIEKQGIIDKLLLSQKYLCAYCECQLDIYKRNFHIEHFFEQSDYPTPINTLDYSNNLILSCQGDINPTQNNETQTQRTTRISNITCGHKKGRSYHQNQGVNYGLLLNPQSNIHHLFKYGDDGSINASIVCTQQQRQQVFYTIKRLNLDCDKLNRRRNFAIESLLQELQSVDPEDYSPFLTLVLDEGKTKFYPFFSTLKQNFSYLI